MNWYYIDGPLRVGPLGESEWADLLRSGKVTPETLVWHEGMEKWTPYSQIAPQTEPPELDEQEETVRPEDPAAYAARVADLDYPVDINGCVSRAWGVFKRYFWMAVGSMLLILVLVGAGANLPYVGFIMTMVLQGVLMGGLYFVFLRLIRNEPVEIPDLFAGFGPDYFKPLALQTLVNYFVSQLCMTPFVIALTLKGGVLTKAESYHDIQAFVESDPLTAMALSLVLLAGLIPAVYFSFCWMFAVPLIVDKKLPFWPAMQLSRAKVLQHPWRISFLLVWAGILSVLGSLPGLVLVLGFHVSVASILPVIFTLPLGSLILLCLYEGMFGGPARKPDPQTE